MQDHFPAGLIRPLTFCKEGSSVWDVRIDNAETICKLLPQGIFVVQTILVDYFIQM